jgi:hypothetical protein
LYTEFAKDEAQARKLQSSPLWVENKPLALQRAVDPAREPIYKLISINPEEVYVVQNSTAVEVSGIDVTISEFMYNSGLDLRVIGVKVSLPPRMAFQPKHVNTTGIRTVHIHAREIVVHESGTLIDVHGGAGESPWDGVPAAHGASWGENGTDGANGVDGPSGGLVILEAALISGGNLSIDVGAGNGGNGQDGGDGARGAPAEPNTDSEACCSGRDTTGKEGNRGGSGGNGGRGGNAGKPGRVQVRYYEGSVPVEVHNPYGVPGTPGAAGAAGVGSEGSVGTGTSCVRVSFLFWDHRCFPPFGDRGATGAAGSPGETGASGSAWTSSRVDPSIEQMALADIRNMGCGPWLNLENFAADHMYRSEKWAEAKQLYEWTSSVMNTTLPLCASLEYNGWKEQTILAGTKLQQLALQYDFWGRQRNFVPLLSAASLAESTISLFRVGRAAKEAVLKFTDEFTSEDDQLNIARDSTTKMDNEINSMQEQLEGKVAELSTFWDEIKILDEERANLTRNITFQQEECEVAVTKKAAAETYGWQPTLRRIGRFFGNVVTAVFQQAATLTSLAISAVSAWRLAQSTTNTLFGNAASARTAQSRWTLAVFTAPNLVNTVITSVRAVGASIVASTNEINTTLRGVQQEFIDSRSSITDHVRTVADQQYTDTVVAWLADLPECQDVVAQVQSLIDKNEVLDGKLQQYDSTVLSYGVLSTQRSQVIKERASLLNEMAGKFDPAKQVYLTTLYAEYTRIRYEIISVMKQMRGAMNYEFCEDEVFSYNTLKLEDLEAELQEMLRHRTESNLGQGSGRKMMAKFEGDHPTAAVVVSVPATDEFRTTGKISFELSSVNAGLPGNVANLRLASAQAYVPTLSGGVVQVWIKKQGDSKCIHPSGIEHSFVHASNSYYTMYDAATDPVSPQFLTDHTHADSFVEPSPLGQWELKVISAQDRTSVTEIRLHLLLSFVACERADCSPIEVQGESGSTQLTLMSDAGADVSSPSQGLFSGGGLVTMSGVSFVLFSALAAVVLTRSRGSPAVVTESQLIEEA